MVEQLPAEELLARIELYKKQLHDSKISDTKFIAMNTALVGVNMIINDLSPTPENLIGGVTLPKLIELLKSESVFELFNDAYRSPNKNGMSDLNCKLYYDLHDVILELRAENKI